MGVRVQAITAADLPAVAEFLHSHLNRRVPAHTWARAAAVPWKVDAPNHGFLLRSGDRVVGVYLAFYSERVLDGRPVRFCNLGAWCVLPEHRFHGPRLLQALLAQEGYHFTDLSPSGSVVAINTRLGFRRLDPTTFLVPNLPWPTLPAWLGRGRPRRRGRPGGRSRGVSADPARLASTLAGPAWRLYQDHADTAAARHLVLTEGDRWCYVIFRRDRRRRLPLFASVLYVSDPDLFRRLGRRFGRHLLLRHGVLATLAEQRVVRHRPAGSVRLAGRPKMFRSPDLEPAQVDNLYSELVCVAW